MKILEEDYEGCSIRFKLQTDLFEYQPTDLSLVTTVE